MENWLTLNLVPGQYLLPALLIELDGCITHDQEVEKTHGVRKHSSARANHLSRSGCVVVMNAAGLEVTTNHPQELLRQKRRNVCPIIEGRVHHDGVELPVGIR